MIYDDIIINHIQFNIHIHTLDHNTFTLLCVMLKQILHQMIN